MPPTHLTARQQMPNSPDVPQANTTNFPVIALGVAFAAFLLACLGICCCSYNHRRTSRNARKSSGGNYTQLQGITRAWPRPPTPGQAPASGLGLKHLHETSVSLSPRPEEQLPPYEESERPVGGASTSALLLTPVPDLVVSSPAVSAFSDHDEDESRRLLGSGFRYWGVTPPPTPPAPTYAGPA